MVFSCVYAVIYWLRCLGCTKEAHTHLHRARTAARVENLAQKSDFDELDSNGTEKDELQVYVLPYNAILCVDLFRPYLHAQIASRRPTKLLQRHGYTLIIGQGCRAHS